jgi:hypothetical protein
MILFLPHPSYTIITVCRGTACTVYEIAPAYPLWYVIAVYVLAVCVIVLLIAVLWDIGRTLWKEHKQQKESE